MKTIEELREDYPKSVKAMNIAMNTHLLNWMPIMTDDLAEYLRNAEAVRSEA
jgi:hypothetical protein